MSVSPQSLLLDGQQRMTSLYQASLRRKVVETVTSKGKEAVRTRKPKTRYAVGGGAKILLFMRSILSDRAFDAIMRMAARQAAKSPA